MGAKRTDLLIQPSDRIFVSGAICLALHREDCKYLLTASPFELDLEDDAAVQRWFNEHKAKVGALRADNTYPADFLLDNLKIQTNVIETVWRLGVRRLLFFGSSCIYPNLPSGRFLRKCCSPSPVSTPMRDKQLQR